MSSGSSGSDSCSRLSRHISHCPVESREGRREGGGGRRTGIADESRVFVESCCDSVSVGHLGWKSGACVFRGHRPFLVVVP